MTRILFLLLIFTTIRCSMPRQIFQDQTSKKNDSNNHLDSLWYLKDINKDSTPGISLERAYKELIKNKKGKEIVVAVIDTELDIDHEDLKDNIWVNSNEIPNNGVDDDQNGYIDDIRGWNYLGMKNGKSNLYNNYESTRIIRHFRDQFEGKSEEAINPQHIKDYELYKRALDEYNIELKKIKAKRYRSDFFQKGYPKAIKTLSAFFPNSNYNKKEIDSLYQIYEKDTIVGKDIWFMKEVIDRKLSKQRFDEYEKEVQIAENTLFNENYYDRKIIGDDEFNLKDLNYGNNDVSSNAKELLHSIQVSGLIASKRNNNIGINGFSNQIKIMPLAVAVYGDEYDKDLALAIRYAVDNGATVINMSLGKKLSLNPKWLKEAVLYAEQHDVLIVQCSGNFAEDLDLKTFFPTDNTNNIDFTDSYLRIGGISSNIDTNFVYKYSSYGKKNVDVFAPAVGLYTTYSDRKNKKYTVNEGTSLACALVSGTAALIRSYYPNLTAKQVKDIILESGVAYDLMVIKPGTKDELVHFSELSKSGKVVNVYNAMLLAEQVSKGKVKL